MVTKAITLRAGPQSAATARLFLRRTAVEWGVDEVAEVLLLVATELVSNALTHGRSEVHLRVDRQPRLLRVEVEDGDSRLPVLHAVGPDALGGRGLTVVDALAARWGSKCVPAGKVVWAELPLSA